MTRAERYALADSLRSSGLKWSEIAAEMGLSIAALKSLFADPDGSKQRERRKRYQGRCVDCGSPTDGSGGRARAPERCLRCALATIRAAHGTRSRYQARCRCPDCTAAQRAYMRTLKDREPPRHGTPSSYRNYGCRCGRCRRAHSRYQRELRERRAARG